MSTFDTKQPEKDWQIHLEREADFILGSDGSEVARLFVAIQNTFSTNYE
jgi:hypothetical protein